MRQKTKRDAGQLTPPTATTFRRANREATAKRRPMGKPSVVEAGEGKKLSPKAAELLAILAYPVKKQQEVDRILAELR